MAQALINGKLYEIVLLGDPITGNPVSPGGGGAGGGGSTIDRELVTTHYRVTTAFTGASLGDIITQSWIIDVTGTTPTTVGIAWRNQTTGLDLASPPTISNLTQLSSTSLTDAQLRATPLIVQPGAPRLTSGPFFTRTTNATGATYNALTGVVCSAARFMNTQPGAVDIEVQLGGTGPAVVIPAGCDVIIPGITNASDLGIRRQDQSNTPVTVTGQLFI